MIVVSDTGPLNYLALIGYVEALPKLYEVVVIPKAVASELSRPSCPETVRALIESPPVWLKIDQAPEPDPDLSALGDGEQQAIALARTLHADLLLCDDRDARDAALRKNLRVIGTLGVLQEASQNGLLDLTDALAKLRNTNFRASKSLIDRILEIHRRA
jgi:predicted nucleic acid-binding protein